MPHQYRDAVCLIQKSRDGTLSRVNAIVLASTVQPANVNRHHALKDRGAVLPEGEYLDLAFPRDLAGHQLKSSNMDAVFQKAYHVPEWEEDAWIGWAHLPSVDEIDEFASAYHAGHERDVKEKQDLRAEILLLEEKLSATQQAPASQPPQNTMSAPSAADLDAIAAEQKAAEETSGA